MGHFNSSLIICQWFFCKITSLYLKARPGGSNANSKTGILSFFCSVLEISMRDVGMCDT